MLLPLLSPKAMPIRRKWSFVALPDKLYLHYPKTDSNGFFWRQGNYVGNIRLKNDFGLRLGSTLSFRRLICKLLSILSSCAPLQHTQGSWLVRLHWIASCTAGRKWSKAGAVFCVWRRLLVWTWLSALLGSCSRCPRARNLLREKELRCYIEKKDALAVHTDLMTKPVAML